MTNEQLKGRSRITGLLFIVGLLFVIMLCGCAKTVTPLFPAGNHITVSIDYRGNIDPILNRYYIIFNNNAAPKIPFMPIQFVEPGEIAQQPEINYYLDYYPSWKAYIVLDGNALYFVRGPYTSEAVPTKEVMATWSGMEIKRIEVTFNLDKFDSLAERLNFDFVTVDKETKIVKDNLSPLNSSPSPYYVFTIADSTVSGSDETTTVTRESLDILDWRVLIQ